MKLPKGKVLKNGDQGNLVKELQRHLRKCGYKLRGANEGVDGDYGDSTEAAVRYFQNLNPPLEIDGKVGKATAERLDLCAAYAQATAKAVREKSDYDVFTFFVEAGSFLEDVGREWLKFIERWGLCLGKRGHKKEHVAALLVCLKALKKPSIIEVLECLGESLITWQDLVECYWEAANK